MRDLDNHFGAYNHLVHLPRADEALFTLRKAASCVKPMMRKRGWRVGLLSEFLPDQPNLLGLNTNRGEQIQLRLRHPGDFNQFLPFDQVLDTLLHELCHNVWGPHDHNFHNLWNELRDEWETLQLKGFSGEGFLGKGQALGGSRIPVEEVRRRARVAAQERAKLNKSKFDPGRRLGGSSSAPPPRSRTRLRDILAGAAQSRNKANTVEVDDGCANGTQVGNKAAEDALRNGFQTKAEMDDANSIAIAQALQELYEQEEDDRIYEGLAGPPATGGLTWDPELGLQPVSSAPTSRSTTPNPPPKPVQQYPPRTSSRPAGVTASAGTSSIGQNGAYDVNSQGRPVSRLVREAEAQQRRKNHVPMEPTPALQNWLESETGANFGSARPTSVGSADGSTWECSQCTFHNHGMMDRCEMCDGPKPAAASRSTVQRKPAPQVSYTSSSAAASAPLGWVCVVCGTFMESNWWTCSQCGTMKVSS